MLAQQQPVPQVLFYRLESPLRNLRVRVRGVAARRRQLLPRDGAARRAQPVRGVKRRLELVTDRRASGVQGREPLDGTGLAPAQRAPAVEAAGRRRAKRWADAVHVVGVAAALADEYLPLAVVRAALRAAARRRGQRRRQQREAAVVGVAVAPVRDQQREPRLVLPALVELQLLTIALAELPVKLPVALPELPADLLVELLELRLQHERGRRAAARELAALRPNARRVDGGGHDVRQRLPARSRHCRGLLVVMPVLVVPRAEQAAGAQRRRAGEPAFEEVPQQCQARCRARTVPQQLPRAVPQQADSRRREAAAARSLAGSLSVARALSFPRARARLLWRAARGG